MATDVMCVVKDSVESKITPRCFHWWTDRIRPKGVLNCMVRGRRCWNSIILVLLLKVALLFIPQSCAIDVILLISF